MAQVCHNIYDIYSILLTLETSLLRQWLLQQVRNTHNQTFSFMVTDLGQGDRRFSRPCPSRVHFGWTFLVCHSMALRNYNGSFCSCSRKQSRIPNVSNRMSDADVSAGLVLPYAAVALLGSGGAVCTLLIVFMAVTSASSSEYIAVSSIFTYDIYATYINTILVRKKSFCSSLTSTELTCFSFWKKVREFLSPTRRLTHANSLSYIGSFTCLIVWSRDVSIYTFGHLGGN